MTWTVAVTQAVMDANREELEGDLESMTDENIEEEMREAEKRFPRRIIKAGIGMLAPLITLPLIKYVDINTLSDWQFGACIWLPFVPAFYGIAQIYRGLYDDSVCEIGQNILEKRKKDPAE